MASGLFGRGATVVLAALSALLAAGPAAAEICDLKVYDASRGKRLQESDTVFAKDQQFIVCFKPLKDGYVSLWDRIPRDAPVERLAPSPKFEKSKARQVTAGEPQCFGDGSAEPGATGYVLLMEASDGFGLGRMWLVFSEHLEDHPGEQAFDSVSMFKGAYERRFGAGSMKIEPDTRADEAPPPSGCASAGSLDYFYRVTPGDGS